MQLDTHAHYRTQLDTPRLPGHPHATTPAKTCYADMHTRLLALTPARPHHLDRLPLLIPDVAGERALGGMLLLGIGGRLEDAPTLRGGMPEVTCT